MKSNRSIEFEFKFSKNFSEHEIFKQRYLDLLEQFAEDCPKADEIDKIVLFQVERLGFSGAKVFYLYVKRKTGKEDKKIAKFDEYSKIEQESAKAKSFGEDVYGPYETKDAQSESYGLMIYEEIEYGDEFHYLFLDSTKTAEYLSNILENLYLNLFNTIYKAGKTESSKKIVEDYTWYLTRKNQPIAKLESLKGYFGDFRLQEFYDFYYMMTSSSHEINCTLIHGDLHARNIMSNDTKASLIDFAWVHEGHIAKDFTLLECTVLHMLLPDYMLKRTNTHIFSSEYDSFLTSIYTAFELDKFEDISDDTNRNIVYRRAFECIKVIRKYGGMTLKIYKSSSFKDIFSEYKYSILLMSLSQISFESAKLEILMSTTNKILEKLDEAI